jgi:hypothetical protein
MSKCYVGFRLFIPSQSGKPVSAGCRVEAIDDDGRGRPLDPRLDLWNHSPTGFEWGYGGSGPAQLALALAADATKDRLRALHVYQRLKFRVVGRLPHDGWSMSAEELLAAIQSIEDEETIELTEDPPADE